MQILRYPLGDLSANCYIIINKDRKAIAIDVGGTPSFLQLEALKHGFEITDILLTHSHFDHMGGVSYFEKRGAKVYISSDDLVGVQSGEYNLSTMFGGSVEPFNVYKTLQGGETLSINGFIL